tara:strand:+ start:398 stop:727 length:330 start_codon:yes stop_codon:yes gene_type:complete
MIVGLIERLEVVEHGLLGNAPLLEVEVLEGNRLPSPIGILALGKADGGDDLPLYDLPTIRSVMEEITRSGEVRARQLRVDVGLWRVRCLGLWGFGLGGLFDLDLDLGLV